MTWAGVRYSPEEYSKLVDAASRLENMCSSEMKSRDVIVICFVFCGFVFRSRCRIGCYNNPYSSHSIWYLLYSELSSLCLLLFTCAEFYNFLNLSISG
jgi:hypothetical protein